MPESVLMGIDLGTSSLKVVLVNPDGRTVGFASKEYAFDTPHPGWAEQDPQVWVDAALEAAGRAVSESGLTPRAVQAVGLSGQMHGLVCVNGDGRPVRPAVIWADQRSAVQVERITREIGSSQLGQWTANPVATGFMLPSWLWIAEHEPQTLARTEHLLLPKDYLRFALTGCLGVEPSDASSTLMFDTAGRTWSHPLLAALGIDAGLLLPLSESSAVAGGLTREAARRTGLPEGLPVVFGGSDQALAALGQGLIHPGRLVCSISTGGQMVTPLDRPVYDPQLRTHTFCHVLENRWYLMAATLSAGLALRWLRDNIFKGTTYARLADLADQAGSSDGVFFLPHLAGERTPYMDSSSRAGFWGLTLRHTQAHMVRAVMEGVVFSLRACLDLIQELGVPVEQVIASGGGARHPLWLRLMADTFGRPVARTESVEASALGAAMLAGVAAGVYPDAETACRRAVHPTGELILPDPRSQEASQRAYETYTRLYPAFKSLRGTG
ncbi:MAG TPA: xylulokinase [Anaerolineaceae bacterium]